MADPIPRAHDDALLQTFDIAQPLGPFLQRDTSRPWLDPLYCATTFGKFWFTVPDFQRNAIRVFSEKLRYDPHELVWHLGRVVRYVDIERRMLRCRKFFVEALEEETVELPVADYDLRPPGVPHMFPVSVTVQSIRGMTYLALANDLFENQYYLLRGTREVDNRLPADMGVLRVTTTDDWVYSINRSRVLWASIQDICDEITSLNEWFEDPEHSANNINFGGLNLLRDHHLDMSSRDVSGNLTVGAFDHFLDHWSTDDNFIRGGRIYRGEWSILDRVPYPMSPSALEMIFDDSDVPVREGAQLQIRYPSA